MLRDAGLRVKLALVGFIVVCGFVARVAWVAMGSGGESGSIEVSPVAETVVLAQSETPRSTPRGRQARHRLPVLSPLPVTGRC